MRALSNCFGLLKGSCDSTDLIAISIASCISLASIKQNPERLDPSPKDFHPSIDHVYWETRENALAMSGVHGIFFPDIIRYHVQINKSCTRDEIEQMAEATWFDVASPTLLIAEVMEV